MIVDNSKFSPSFPDVMVEPTNAEAPAPFFVSGQGKAGKTGMVIDTYSGCDWVIIGASIGYKTANITIIRFNNTLYHLVPYTDIVFVYVASIS